MRGRYMAILLIFAAGTLIAVGAAKEQESSQAGDPLWEQATLYFQPLPEVAANPDNPITEAKIGLGRDLYFDTRLSLNSTISCNSCHSLALFGTDGLPTSPGDDGRTGDRNSPTVLNAALHGSQFWDGRARDVEEQAGMPILNPVEMAIPSKEFLVERLSQVREYRDAFRNAFPDDAEPLSYGNIQKALGAFERTLLAPSSFDDYLRGDRAALGADQLEGLRLFMNLGCSSCHNGVNVGAASFRKFGLNDPYWVHTCSAKIDEGRLKVTGDEEDRYVFRVASLRNVAETAPYFHDGSVAKLDDALTIMVQLQVGLDLEPLQVRQLAAFLGSLTGRVDAAVAAGAEPAGTR